MYHTVQRGTLSYSLATRRLHYATRHEFVRAPVTLTRMATLDRLGVAFLGPLAQAEPTSLPLPPHLGHHVASRGTAGGVVMILDRLISTGLQNFARGHHTPRQIEQ